MIVCTKISELDFFLDEFRAKNASIGFVPTMGALHKGHLSLIETSKSICEITVCSIFVNPNQFNNKEDLIKYPRTPEHDIRMLESSGCNVLFMPNENEIYPQPDKTVYNFGELGNVLEGEFRVGHFNGVAQVVRRLFEIVKPQKAFFGSKDYQQVLIVKALVKQLNLDLEIISCPILREEDGLAMSSRNVRLSIEERKLAGLIPKWMLHIKEIILDQGFLKAESFLSEQIKLHSIFQLEYLKVCNKFSLAEIKSSEKGNRILLIAIFVGSVRLIDNLEID